MHIDMLFENHGHKPLPPPTNLMGRHPKGTGARVLLTSVFGPYGCDDEFGSRSINPMELYHNQVTRRAGRILTPDVPPLLGDHDDPAKYRRALYGTRLPQPRELSRGARRGELRHLSVSP